MAITSPYNFVPLNHDVFIPSWGRMVSHDIPFSDGEDGVIRFSLKNLSPLHVSQGKGGDGVSLSCHIDSNGEKRYFIPASSIKGMLRSVAEILGFAKLRFFNDDYFGYRTFTEDRYKLEMENPLCGFLKKEGDDLVIYSCGTPERIEISQIEDSIFKREGKTLVKSGKMNGKRYEHLFGPRNGERHEIPSEVAKVFLTVYKPNKEFEGKLDKLKNGGELSVFYHLDEDGKVKHLGLSRNYRLPYKHNVASAVSQQGKDIDGNPAEGRDMIEILFGYIDDEQSLKGRVQVGHAFCTDTIQEASITTKSGVLGQPQASYTPFYLKQGKQGTYASYDDEDVEIAGRKRYRIHTDQPKVEMPQGNGNSKVMTKLRLLPAGNEFQVSVAVHNLKPCEIGLLLSALTFHNTATAHHSIGMGKSFGYGKLEVSNVLFQGLKGEDAQHYLRAFEEVLCRFTWNAQHRDWSQTEQVKTLVAIASDHCSPQELRLMSLKEYGESKKSKNYGRLSEPNVNVAGFFSLELEEAQRLQAQRRLEESRRQEERRKAEEEEKRRQQELLERQQQAEALKAEAQTLFNAAQYQEAKRKCDEAKALNPDIAIRELEERINTMLNAGNETIEQFAQGLKIASVNAFAGNCEKRKKAGNVFQPSDMDVLAEYIKGNMPVANKKEWATLGKWGRLRQTLGEEMAKSLFNKINNL